MPCRYSGTSRAVTMPGVTGTSGGASRAFAAGGSVVRPSRHTAITATISNRPTPANARLDIPALPRRASAARLAVSYGTRALKISGCQQLLAGGHFDRRAVRPTRHHAILQF